MGKSIALVKCKSDNSIYIGVYNGTSDTLERYFKPIDKYESFEKLIEEIKSKYYARPPFNEEPCEIYSDYGGGFWWNGTFDRKQRAVVKGYTLDCIECERYGYEPEIHNEIPDWVNEVLGERQMSITDEIGNLPAVWKLENPEGLYCPKCKLFMPDYENPLDKCPRCGKSLEGWIDGSGMTVDECIKRWIE